MLRYQKFTDGAYVAAEYGFSDNLFSSSRESNFSENRDLQKLNKPSAN